jgi:cytochrome b561
VVNLALLVGMTLCILSGILISRVALPYLGINLTRIGPFWSTVHDTTAEITLGLVPVHVALRWRWLVRNGRRLLAWRAR